MPSERERRKFMRIDTALEAEYWAKGPSMATGRAAIRNFCREGLGLLLPTPIRRGEHIDLTLRVPGDNVPIFATGEVTWSDSETEKKGRVGVGMRFLSIKPLDLARLLDFVYSHWLGGVKGNLLR